jgi:hypothetical protein
MMQMSIGGFAGADSGCVRWCVACGLVAGALLVGTGPSEAQTDFYNLDKDRPLRVEDAYATKRYAFEWQVAPLQLSEMSDGRLVYAPSLELKHGLLPGLEVSAGTNLNLERFAGEMTTGLGDVELSALLNLFIETRTLPAVGVRATGHIAVNADHESTFEIKGLATRGLSGPVRLHVNGAYVFNDPLERWWAGAALDYVLPFHHTLLLLETYLSLPQEGTAQVHSTAGFRYQLTPTLGLDAGVGRSWRGERAQEWVLTFGLTREFGVRALMPVGRR